MAVSSTPRPPANQRTTVRDIPEILRLPTGLTGSPKSISVIQGRTGPPRLGDPRQRPHGSRTGILRRGSGHNVESFRNGSSHPNRVPPISGNNDESTTSTGTTPYTAISRK